MVSPAQSLLAVASVEAFEKSCTREYRDTRRGGAALPWPQDTDTIGLDAAFACYLPPRFKACAMEMSQNSRQRIEKCCRIHHAFTKSIRREICRPQLSRFVRRTVRLQIQARRGTRLMPSRTQVSRGSA